MKKSILSLICICCMIAAVSCQKTPENANVLSVRDFLENLAETPFVPYEAPERVKANETRSGLNIFFDAAVTVPAASAYGITEVRQVQYTEDDYLRLMEYFSPGTTWVNRPEQTKADMIRQYYEIQNSDRFTESEKEEYESLLEAAKYAPEVALTTPFSIKQAMEQGRGYAWSTGDEGKPSESFSFYSTTWNWQYMRVASASIMQKDFLQPEYTESDALLLPDFAHDPLISKDDACAVAWKLIEEMGLASDFAVYTAEKAIAYEGREPSTYGWQFIFTRTSNGLQAPFDFDGWATWETSPQPAYAAPWSREMISIFVDPDGIYKCDVRGLSAETKVMYENVTLLPFDQLLERIKKQLVYQHAYQEEGVTGQMVTVSSITLGLSVINEKDKPGYGMLIPSWTVEYRFSYNEDAFDYNFDTETVFNAIDGSYIEPRASAGMLGYS